MTKKTVIGSVANGNIQAGQPSLSHGSKLSNGLCHKLAPALSWSSWTGPPGRVHVLSEPPGRAHLGGRYRISLHSLGFRSGSDLDAN
jgi:hypothetical protein